MTKPACMKIGAFLIAAFGLGVTAPAAAEELTLKCNITTETTGNYPHIGDGEIYLIVPDASPGTQNAQWVHPFLGQNISTSVEISDSHIWVPTPTTMPCYGPPKPGETPQSGAEIRISRVTGQVSCRYTMTHRTGRSWTYLMYGTCEKSSMVNKF